MPHRHREPAPGVLRLVLPLPFPGLDHVNCYALTSAAGVTLVDGGIFDPDPTSDHGWTELEDACEAAGFGQGAACVLLNQGFCATPETNCAGVNGSSGTACLPPGA